MRRGWLVVFAKRPEAGQVKTRLCPPFSPDQAAELYRCLLADTLDVSARAAAALDLEPVLAVDPPGSAGELVAAAPRGFRAVAQRGADLGARMTRIAREAAAAGARCALLRGSDSPTLAERTLRDAALAVDGADVALSPDRDGGYGLVALGPRALLATAQRPGLFDHPMSTPSVRADTEARAARLGLRVVHVTGGFDVDRAEDLHALAAARHENASIDCPRTLAFLDAAGLWPARGVARGTSSR